jgi:hypothetical protein
MRKLLLAVGLAALSACASTASFRLPASQFYEDFRGDFGPGPSERHEGDVLAIYVYPSAVTDGHCRRTRDGTEARCHFSYTYGSIGYAREGLFVQQPDGSWRYVRDSARNLDRSH